MKTNKMTEVIRERYGSNVYQMILRFDGRYEDILDTYDAILSANEPDPIAEFAGITPEEATITQCYKALVDCAMTLWLSRISREQMLATLNTLVEAGTITLQVLPDCSHTPWTLASAWSAANPDQAPIRCNSGVSI